MDIGIQKEDLAQSIQKTQGAVSVRSTLPILSNLLLEAFDNQLRLTATDLDIAITSVISAKVNQKGAVTLPAKRFSDVIRELDPSEEISLQLKKNMTVEIKSGKSVFKLIGLSKDDFPQVPEYNSPNKALIPQDLLSQMLKLTAFAMSRDDARYVLNGILFSFQPKILRLVATDGRRLAMIDREFSKEIDFAKNIIVPVKAIQELNRSLTNDGDVEIGLKDNQVQFKINNTMISSRLIEGEFPNYEQVIPKATKEQVVIDTQKFLQATRRASIFTHQESQSIRLDFSKNRMVITKSTPDVGELKEEVEASYQGGNFAIGFNPNYLIDVLKNIKEENVRLELIDPEKPGMIKIRDNYTYIVLPMQLS